MSTLFHAVIKRNNTYKKLMEKVRKLEKWEFNYIKIAKDLLVVKGIMLEQRWPSDDALDSDQHGPGFMAHRRPLATSGRAFGPKCSRQN